MGLCPSPVDYANAAREASRFSSSHHVQMDDDATSSNNAPVAITNFIRPEIPPKCFGTDIDGTFLAEDPAMFQRNLDAFSWAVENGIDIFFCTGRGYEDAMRVLPRDLVEKLGFTGYPGVYYNGGAVYGRNGEVLTEAVFNTDTLKRIIDRIVEAKHEKYTMFLTRSQWHVVTDDMSFFDELTASLGLQTPFTLRTVDELLADKIMKVIVVYYDNLAHKFQDMEDVEFIAKRALNDLTDLTPMGITKGSGIASVLKHLGLTPDQCGYIGDAANDIEAMQLVRHSFAVDNASQAVKDSAKYTVQQTNENAAFRTVMEALYGGIQN
ncbi:HAD superfamily hydrolase, putative [Babesia bigemina]|uniref:HAD superfamily hydrolase, putative n=1 Tax=Babesia bigemina TaxID=5866 RepID=A0A061D1X3_BABBI|nr:HAD superfamily hydrolase, putative [Babesia bigemina]CDR94771.1 HAD superfamily hydrolase, putative [Babesia bigemina]|eukprot:XP_012766957.1 HAD superfamily hydrolase, putative [Babesia bigemina]